MPRNPDEESASSRANDAMALADAALGAAGHEVTDPRVRDNSARRARGEITSDEGIEEIKALIADGYFRT